MVLPLPEGEGRGEGEGSIIPPPDTSWSLTVTAFISAFNFITQPVGGLHNPNRRAVLFLDEHCWNAAIGKDTAIRRKANADALAAREFCACRLVHANAQSISHGEILRFGVA